MDCLQLFYAGHDYTRPHYGKWCFAGHATTVKITHLQRIRLIVRNHVDNGNIRTFIDWELGIALQTSTINHAAVPKSCEPVAPTRTCGMRYQVIESFEVTGKIKAHQDSSYQEMHLLYPPR